MDHFRATPSAQKIKKSESISPGRHDIRSRALRLCHHVCATPPEMWRDVMRRRSLYKEEIQPQMDAGERGSNQAFFFLSAFIRVHLRFPSPPRRRGKSNVGRNRVEKGSFGGRKGVGLGSVWGRFLSVFRHRISPIIQPANELAAQPLPRNFFIQRVRIPNPRERQSPCNNPQECSRWFGGTRRPQIKPNPAPFASGENRECNSELRPLYPHSPSGNRGQKDYFNISDFCLEKKNARWAHWARDFREGPGDNAGRGWACRFDVITLRVRSHRVTPSPWSSCSSSSELSPC